MKTLLRFLAIFPIALLPALSETAKERAHEAEAASQPQTHDSQKLAAKQIDKSISDLKEALAGLTLEMIASWKELVDRFGPGADSTPIR